MNKNFVFFFFAWMMSSITANVYAETYRPFIEEGKVWRTGIPDTNGDGYSHIYHYRLFYFSNYFLIGRSAIRIIGHGVEAEIDTIRVGLLFEENRKVYHASPDTQDFTLLYDFVSPVGSDINIAGEDLTIINKEWVQDDSFKGECIYLKAKGSEQPTICWMEGVGNMSNPMESLYTTGTSNEVLLYCKVGDEVLYYNGNPFLNGIGGEVKKNTIDFTHVVKAQPKAPRRGRSGLNPDSSPVGEGREGSEEEEMLTGAYSINELFVDFKALTGIYVITICDDSGTEVYRKDVQTSNVMGLNKLIGGYAKGVYTLTVENDAEAYMAEFSIDEEVGIGRPTPDPSRNGGEKAGAWYDLSGRQIVNSKSSNGKWNKGIYIRDGKKVVVR